MTEEFAHDREALARVEAFTYSLPLDGTAIPLRKTIQGIPLVLRARNPTNTALHDDVERFNPDSSFLLFNISGHAQDQQIKVGFMDWEIAEGLAVCGPLQQYIAPQQGLEDLSFDEPPKRAHGFYVEKDFRRNGVGDFLTALSLATLCKLGIGALSPGTYVTNDAISRWEKFGINTQHWPKNPYSLPLAAANPRVNRSLAAFV